ncbi:MAG: FtsW/RodA/SpoVE family cell cycle protein [Sphaerochaetaceae bacterium]|nr:FtsW/RodA/SpoVE family cell cycle protein [Sphaerochaetaceae bacterium]
MTRPDDYDDWNLNLGQTAPRAVHVQPYDGRVNGFVFCLSVSVLTVMGLLCVYSASYPAAIADGKVHYLYLVNQIIYTMMGMFLGIAVFLMPEKIIRTLCPVCMLSCLCILCADFMFGKTLLLQDGSVWFVYLSFCSYLSLFFANREDGISNIRQIIIPVCFSIAFFLLLLFLKNFTYAFVFFVMTVVMFAAGSVGIGGILLFVIFAMVPGVCRVLSDPDRVRMLLDFAMRGDLSVTNASQMVLRRSAFVSGSLAGKGLGLGVYKNGLINGISGEYIFCNICEEAGLLSVFFILVLLMVVAATVYQRAANIRLINRYFSNLITGIATVICMRVVLNLLACVNIVPGAGIGMPFFSSGPQIIVIMIECSLVLKSNRTYESPGTSVAKLSTKDVRSEVDFESQNG